MIKPPTHTSKNREAWLSQAVDLMRGRLFANHGLKVPDKVRISVGFPQTSRGGRIGECWAPSSSSDGTAEIFVHPKIDDAVRVLDITAHELVHTINHADGASGHGKVFKDIAVKIGLTGKMTSTEAGPDLRNTLADYATHLGPFPHSSLTPGTGPVKKQGTRMIKVLCPRCTYSVRTTQKWIDVGLPQCPCGELMILEDEKQDEEDDV